MCLYPAMSFYLLIFSSNTYYLLLFTFFFIMLQLRFVVSKLFFQTVNFFIHFNFYRQNDSFKNIYNITIQILKLICRIIVQLSSGMAEYFINEATNIPLTILTILQSRRRIKRLTASQASALPLDEIQCY